MASSDDSEVNPHADEGALPPSSLGSGLLAQHSTPSGVETIAVAKLCPQCGNEYLTSDRFCPRDGSPLRPKAGDDPLIGRVIADRYLIMDQGRTMLEGSRSEIERSHVLEHLHV